MKLNKVWVVRDATHLESEMADVIFCTTMDALPEYVMGTGGIVWRQEHTAVYTEESEARCDAEKRLNLKATV